MKQLKAVDTSVIREMLARINKLEARAKKKGFYEPICNVVVGDSYLIKKGHGMIEVADIEVTIIGQLWSMDLKELADECSGQSGPIFYNAIDLLAIASKINGMYGFRAMSKEDMELGKWGTASRVRAYLHSGTVFAEIGSITDADKEFALKVKEHILNKKGASQYISNIQSLLNAEYVKFDHINLLVSALGVYLKEVNSSDKDKETYTENFIGAVKDKVELMVLVESIRPVESCYGVSYLVRMTTPDHYLVTWFASKEPEMETGSTYAIKGTVKKHEIYNGVYQTALTRVKKV